MSQCHDTYELSAKDGAGVPHGRATDLVGTQCHDTYPAGNGPVDKRAGKRAVASRGGPGGVPDASPGRGTGHGG